MTLRNKTLQPLFATLSSVALVSCLWMVGCTPAADKAGPDGTEPAVEADDHDHDHDGEDHDHDGEEHDHGDEDKGGGDEEAPAESGPKVDPAADDVKAGEPSFPKLPE